MKTPPAPPLTDDHRRRLRLFSRWLIGFLDADDAARLSIEILARTLDMGGLSRADTLAALDSLDGLLSDVWDRRPRGEVE